MCCDNTKVRTDLFSLEGKDQKRVFMEELAFELDFKGWKGFHKIKTGLGVFVTD